MLHSCISWTLIISQVLYFNDKKKIPFYYLSSLLCLVVIDYQRFQIVKYLPFFSLFGSMEWQVSKRWSVLWVLFNDYSFTWPRLNCMFFSRPPITVSYIEQKIKLLTNCGLKVQSWENEEKKDTKNDYTPCSCSSESPPFETDLSFAYFILKFKVVCCNSLLIHSSSSFLLV